MEQITREELVGLLKALKGFDEDLNMYGVHVAPNWDESLGERLDKAIAALQAAEPVAFRFRSKRLTDEGINPTWIYEEGVPKVHDEILEGCYVEPLFTLPCPPAKAQVPDQIKAVIDECDGLTRLQYISGAYVVKRLREAMLTASPASDPDACTPAMEAAAEKYWKERRFKGLSEDPRTWKGLYKAMCAARQQEEAER